MAREFISDCKKEIIIAFENYSADDAYELNSVFMTSQYNTHSISYNEFLLLRLFNNKQYSQYVAKAKGKRDRKYKGKRSIYYS